MVVRFFWLGVVELGGWSCGVLSVGPSGAARGVAWLGVYPPRWSGCLASRLCGCFFFGLCIPGLPPGCYGAPCVVAYKGRISSVEFSGVDSEN